MLTINRNNRFKSSPMNSNRKVHKSREFNEQNMLYQLERTRERRNALADTSAISTNANISCQMHSYHQLVERVRELEKEIVPDLRLHQILPTYSPFSAITPCSNVSGGDGFSNYPRSKNFSMNLVSPNSSLPTQRFVLSSKILERAHQIPERFWIDWQQKQMQNRIEELEYIKNNLTSPNDIDVTTANRRKSLLLLPQRRISPPRSTSIDNETSSSNTDNNSSFCFNKRSIDETDTDNQSDLNTSSLIESITSIPSVRKSQSTLDRSRLTIFLPFSHTNIPEQTISTNNNNTYHQSFTKSIPDKTIHTKDNSIQTISSASSIEDVAQIDTEFNLTLLLRENQDQTNPLLYSKAIMNRTIEFRSSSPSKKDSSIYQNEISTDEEMLLNERESDDKQSSISSSGSFESARSTFSNSGTIVLTMADEHNYNKDHIPSNSKPKKKKNIRIFVRRKRLSSDILHKSIPSQSNGIEQLTSIIEKNLNIKKKNSRNKKNIVVLNYKPVFVNSRQQKSTESKPIPTNHNNQRHSMITTPSSNNSSNQQSTSFNIPDVEDPLIFIEMMYQQLFTEDGQLRSGNEPTVLANCVKQIVTQSRRNSIASNIHQQKISSTSLLSSSRFIPNTFNEEEEEPNTLFQRNKTINTSTISSKRSSVDNIDHHQQQLHAFLNSYYHPQKRTSTNQTIINSNYPFSIDDTDNEDFDTFSDLNSYRKTIRTSPPTSIDEDITYTESKLLSSSGYQSLKLHQPIISKIHSKNDHLYCSNYIDRPQIIVIPSTSSINIIQPIREIFMKYLNFILISKNIFLIPLFIFLLRQRPMHIGN